MAAAKETTGERVVANDGDYYYHDASHFSECRMASELLDHQTVALLIFGIILVTMAIYYYGRTVGVATVKKKSDDIPDKAEKEMDSVAETRDADDGDPWQKISQEAVDASCQCRLLEGTVVFNIEEVRDVACQSQTTYRRNLLQPRFMPVPYVEGCFPEPSRTKLD